MANTIAKSLTKLAKTRQALSVLPLEQVAARRSTRIDKNSYTAEEQAKCMFHLLLALSSEMVSKDVWYLAMASAQKRAEAAGLKNQAEIFDHLAKALIISRASSFVGHLDETGFF